MKSIIEIKQVG